MHKRFFCQKCRVNYRQHYNPHTFLYQCPVCNEPFQDSLNHFVFQKIRKQKAILFTQIICAIKQAKLRRNCIKAGIGLRVAPGFKCLSRNLIIGDHVHLNNAFIDSTALVTIGNHTFFGPDVKILTATHDISKFGEYRQQMIISKPVSIGNGVFVASDVLILGGTSIGDNSVIGAGSVVTKDIPENSLAAGNPARTLKLIDQKEKQLQQLV